MIPLARPTYARQRQLLVGSSGWESPSWSSQVETPSPRLLAFSSSAAFWLSVQRTPISASLRSAWTFRRLTLAFFAIRYC